MRRALNYALDFEGMNHTLFFGQYKRTNSFFSGTELASSGPVSYTHLTLPTKRIV